MKDDGKEKRYADVDDKIVLKKPSKTKSVKAVKPPPRIRTII